MTPEFYPILYAIIGVGVSLAGFILGLFIYFHNQMNKRFDAQDARMDRMEARMDRLEAKFDRLAEEVNSLKLRVAKLEWMLDAALYGHPTFRPVAAPVRPWPSPAPNGKAAARRRLRRRRRNGAPQQTGSTN